MTFPVSVYVPGPESCELVHQHDGARQNFLKENIQRKQITLVEPEDAQLIILYETWSYKMLDYRAKLEQSNLVKTYSDKILR